MLSVSIDNMTDRVVPSKPFKKYRSMTDQTHRMSTRGWPSARCCCSVACRRLVGEAVEAAAAWRSPFPLFYISLSLTHTTHTHTVPRSFALSPSLSLSRRTCHRYRRSYWMSVSSRTLLSYRQRFDTLNRDAFRVLNTSNTPIRVYTRGRNVRLFSRTRVSVPRNTLTHGRI